MLVAVAVVAFQTPFRALKQQRWQLQRKRHLKINISEIVTVLWLLLFPRIFYCWERARCKWTSRRRRSKYRKWMIYCCVLTLSLKPWLWKLSFGRLRQRIVLSSVLHVQHDYFSWFNQSDHCFLASSVIGSLIGWIKWIRKNIRATRAARFLLQFFDKRSRPNKVVKFSYLWFWRQREPAAVNLSFFAFTWKPFVPSKRKCTSPILYDVNINME